MSAAHTGTVTPVAETIAENAERLLERHLQRSKEWFPHELVPWSRGRDFEPAEQRPAGTGPDRSTAGGGERGELLRNQASRDDDEPEVAPPGPGDAGSASPPTPARVVPACAEADPAQATPGEANLPAGVRSALFINLLTEDNLPHYFHAIAGSFGTDSAMGAWARRWAAEEQRHSIVIRDWVTVNRQLDLVALERARMALLSAGFTSGVRGHSLADGLVYLTLQELATRVSHRQTGAMLGDCAGAALMNRVAADENLHFLFYRDLTSAVLARCPSEVMGAIERQVSGFQMPGAEIQGFAAHAAAVAAAGIYDYRVHYEQVVLPVVVRHWAVGAVTGLDAEGEAARERLLARVERLRRVAERLEPKPGRLQPAAGRLE